MIAIDYVLIAIWLFVLIKNEAALLLLLVLLLDLVMFELFNTDFERYLVVATAYFSSSLLIKGVDRRVRVAVFLFGCIYAVGAFDWFLYLHHNTVTFYYDVMKYLVTGFNAYIAALLLTTGGRNIVGLFDRLRSIVRRRVSWL